MSSINLRNNELEFTPTFGTQLASQKRRIGFNLYVEFFNYLLVMFEKDMK